MDEQLTMMTAIKCASIRLLVAPILGLLIMSHSTLTYAQAKTGYVGTFGEQKEENWLGGSFQGSFK